MAKRGVATLPLHNGSAPRWLFDRMVDLGGAIAEVVIDGYGRDEFLERLADPYWFQAFGCVLGFDWHSSGVTTTTMGALKEALDPETHGVMVAGGKGATSRRTPDELAETPLSLSTRRRDEAARASRLSATVDNACVQDAHTLYHHTMVVSESGRWTVVQQGMDGDAGTARRYHWLSDAVEDLVEEPQAAICAAERRSSVLDLSATGSAETRAVSVDLVKDDPSHLKRYLQSPDQSSLADFVGDDGGGDGGVGGGGVGGVGGGGGSSGVPTGQDIEPGTDLGSLAMPAHHDLGKADLTERAIDQLQCAYEYQPDDYEELLGVEGVGPKSLRALALVAELVHDAGTSREDPAKYAYAHGGKDGTPHPVDRERYDRTIEYMRTVLQDADVGGDTRQSALTRLSELSRDGA